MHPWGSRSPGSPRTIAVVHHPLVPVGGRGAATDASDADLFNRAFAPRRLVGSPFGAVVGGYDEIHSIHLKMFAAASARQVQGDVATCGGSRWPSEWTNSRGEPTRSTSLPCSCSSAVAEAGGWPPGCTRPTGVTCTADDDAQVTASPSRAPGSMSEGTSRPRAATRLDRHGRIPQRRLDDASV